MIHVYVWIFRLPIQHLPVLKRQFLLLVLDSKTLSHKCSLKATVSLLFNSMFNLKSSHPSVGEVGEALLHQDAFQQVRVHHSQYGAPKLIHTAHSHTDIYILTSERIYDSYIAFITANEGPEAHMRG